jgi:hypothetical protein
MAMTVVWSFAPSLGVSDMLVRGVQKSLSLRLQGSGVDSEPPRLCGCSHCIGEQLPMRKEGED